MTDDLHNIRLRPDGSIDTAFYMSRGRQHRSEAAQGLFRRFLLPGSADARRRR
jgi:hypothetical protein